MDDYERRMFEDARKAYAALMACYPFGLDDLNDEEWRNFSEHYQISTYGRVKSFWGKTPKILKPQLHCTGYLCIGLRLNGKRKICRIHRLVAEVFIPNPDNKPQVNHGDGHPLNNHLSNLTWATGSENTQHAYATGLRKSGEENFNAELTHEQVEWCRNAFIPNDREFGASALARKLGKNATVVWQALHGQTYKNAGGKIHKSRPSKIPEEIRAEIRRTYIKGSREFGIKALSEKFGYHLHTIWSVVHEGNNSANFASRRRQ